MPFKSAELKDLAERAWGLGAQVSASTMARWFRTGELAGLVNWLEFFVTSLPTWRQELEEAQAQLAYAYEYRDHAQQQIQKHHELAQQWLAKLEPFRRELEELDPKVRACWEAQWDPETCPAILDRYTWLRDVAIATCERGYNDEKAEEDYWRSEYDRVTRQIQRLTNKIEADQWLIEKTERELREKWRMVL